MLLLNYADGTQVYASGENAFPAGYHDAAGRIRAIFVKEAMALIAGSYRYEKEGFGGDFVITLKADGTYTFYEGYLSSYIQDPPILSCRSVKGPLFQARSPESGSG